MYDDMLETIENRMKSFGYSLQFPATSLELNNLRQRAKVEMACTLPEGYTNFLERTNGLGWNGLIVFATHRSQVVGNPAEVIEGFVEANLNHRDFEPMKEFLVFADDGVVLYVYNLLADKYQVLTRVGLSTLETFDTFQELLLNAFKASCPGSLT